MRRQVVESLEQLFSLKGKVAIVTGGAGVIPSAMAEGLLKAGAGVCLWGRGRSHPIPEAVAELRGKSGAGERVQGVTVDTVDEAAVGEALAETERMLGYPTILVNGVGGNVGGKRPFTEIEIDGFEQVLRLNLVAGLVVPSKVCAGSWKERESGGSIINIASMSSYTPLSGVDAYTAAKTAVLNLTVSAARELAPYRIRVNAIAPGFFIGYQNKALLIADEEKGELTARGRQVIERTPFGRFGQAADLEGVTVFLASDAASGFITGVTIPVDGGFLTHNI